MDLAQSILQELITLQKKNEELARIIAKLEQESDIIIQQFERKIEELQNGLKHELDDKSRAARRYEAEIRDLEGSRNALIKETAQVRESYGAQVRNLEEKIQVLTRSLEKREKEYIELRVSHDRERADLQDEIHRLQVLLTDNETTFKSEITSLNTQVSVLSDRIRSDQLLFDNTILCKDEEISSGKDTLRSMTLRLFEAEEREKTREEQLQSTIDHLNHIIQSERQIRNRELTERDEKISEFEKSLKEAEIIRRKAKEDAEEEISRLNQVNTETVHVITRIGDENKRLSTKLASLSQEYDERIRLLTDTYSHEKDSLHQTMGTLTGKLLSAEEKARQEIQIRDDRLAAAEQEILILEKSHRKVLEDLTRQADDLTRQITGLRSGNDTLAFELEKSHSENAALADTLKEVQTWNETHCQNQNETIEQLQKQLLDTEITHQQKMQIARDSLQEAVHERDQALETKLEREDFYRNEIAGLHEEITAVQDRLKNREEELTREITLRDTRIADTSTNNEALRAEIERLRLQYIRLQETIRAEKDESVHALYREITSLEDQVAGKNTEISALTKKVLRLDAENTRLLQNLSVSAGPVMTESVPSSEEKENVALETPSESTVDPRRREVFTLASDLDDPGRAPEAAKKLTEMGNSIVDLLIPLLHTGSIQRRVWIAVVLYEINDNRATLPLMKLLETPKVHFRELIWEAKNQFRTRSRMGTASAGTVGIRAGSPWPGPDSGT